MKSSAIFRLSNRSLLAAALHLAMSGPGWGAHAVAQFGEPKYPASFEHFEYINPDAPKNGKLNLSVVSQNSSFDKYNPFTLKGKVAPGLLELVFETLTVYSLDEPNTQYGLLADDIQVAPDFGSATFHINPKARFSNGDPVTASDVKYSFDTLISRKASPKFKSYFAEIRQLSVVDDNTVRFEFTRKGRDLSFVAGSLPVFSPKWGNKPNGEKTPFDQLRLEPPIASGAYTMTPSASAQNVTYRRNPDYWGKDIPVRRGALNFDKVVYKLYKDSDTQVAAMRAGDFDFFNETRMRYWCCQFIGKRFDNGELIKQEFEHHNPSAMNGYVLNMRRERFKDVRVREAISYAYDWQWLNHKILDDEFDRQDSYFAHSPLQAKGLPSEAELKLLEPYRAELDPAVFGPQIEQATTKPPSSLRKNMARALELLAEAGWHNTDGVLRNGKGEPFEIEVPGGRGNMLLDAFFLNLQKLGMVLIPRPTDAVADRARMKNFDYDFASVSFREARNPAAELWRNFNSADADVSGSENVIGVKSRVVDELIRKLYETNTQEEQETVAHALDRVLMHGYYVLPWRYLSHHYLIYNQRLQRPKTLPLYYGAYEWVINAWWDGSGNGQPSNPEK
ncbi:extracellular solute-binding protein [Candidatus Methylospira mobilis]|uniref:extracellular solute-binding protein n=1 Tax=Candidatus Methylospira mobilis TaxID=1808979 RepID=UPI0018854644|nr:extracellular solute-binding protein [Candidatus Methylospira mobilis]WNV04181.1 extracellular solute-binding protein [Candidatus Methylospira mobilis]